VRGRRNIARVLSGKKVGGLWKKEIVGCWSIRGVGKKEKEEANCKEYGGKIQKKGCKPFWGRRFR